jgi:hypothetical protein
MVYVDQTLVKDYFFGPYDMEELQGRNELKKTWPQWVEIISKLHYL